MPTMVTNGVRLNYERTGTGPDLVMVHGLGANLAFWYLRMVPLLRHDCRVTVYDLRGHGLSEMPPSGYTPAVMADDLEGLLDGLGADRVHLVGHSFGGIVALEFALRIPERICSLTIADMRLNAFQPTQRLKDWPHFEMWKTHLQRLGLPAPDPEGEADYHLFMYERFAERANRPLARVEKRGTAPSFGGERRVAQRWLHLLDSTTAKADFRVPGPGLERVRQLVPPMLAIYGELSHCLPTCSGLRAAVPCQTFIIPGVGHFFPLTRPALFAGALREFLLRTSRWADFRTAKTRADTVRQDLFTESIPTALPLTRGEIREPSGSMG